LEKSQLVWFDMYAATTTRNTCGCASRFKRSAGRDKKVTLYD
jgi:hypothetical protein